jgi:UDP-glucose 4-epimerase
LVTRLVEVGEQVRVFGTLTRELPRELEVLGGSIELYRGDVRDEEAVAQAMESVDVVYHLGGIGSPTSPAEMYRQILDVNVIGTENILSAAVNAGASRVVVASSASVYGNSPASPKIEDMRPEPQSIYAASKVASEQLCTVFHERHGLETVALRYFNVYGPGQDRDETSTMVVPSFVRALQSGAPVTLYGDGTQTRDFIFIDDVITGTLNAAMSPEVAGKAINLGSGVPTTIVEVVKTLANAMSTSPQISYASEREHEVRESVADITVARKSLNFAPSTPISSGMRHVAHSTLVEAVTERCVQ